MEVPMKLLIITIILCLILPPVFYGINSYSDMQVKQNVNAEIKGLINTVHTISSNDEGTRLEKEIDISDSMFCKLDHVIIGDELGGTYGNTIRYKITGEREVPKVIYPNVPVTSLSNTPFKMGAGKHELVFEQRSFFGHDFVTVRFVSQDPKLDFDFVDVRDWIGDEYDLDLYATEKDVSFEEDGDSVKVSINVWRSGNFKPDDINRVVKVSIVVQETSFSDKLEIDYDWGKGYNTFTFTLGPNELVEGANIVLMIDPDNDIPEVNEENNIVGMVYDTKDIDLSISEEDVTFYRVGEESSNIIITGEIWNLGPDPAKNVEIQVSWERSTGEIVNTKRFSTVLLPGDESYAFQQIWALGKCDKVIIKVDPSKKIHEERELNNDCSISFWGPEFYDALPAEEPSIPNVKNVKIYQLPEALQSTRSNGQPLSMGSSRFHPGPIASAGETYYLKFVIEIPEGYDNDVWIDCEYDGEGPYKIPLNKRDDGKWEGYIHDLYQFTFAFKDLWNPLNLWDNGEQVLRWVDGMEINYVLHAGTYQEESKAKLHPLKALGRMAVIALEIGTSGWLVVENFNDILTVTNSETPPDLNAEATTRIKESIANHFDGVPQNADEIQEFVSNMGSLMHSFTNLLNALSMSNILLTINGDTDMVSFEVDLPLGLGSLNSGDLSLPVDIEGTLEIELGIDGHNIGHIESSFSIDYSNGDSKVGLSITANLDYNPLALKMSIEITTMIYHKETRVTLSFEFGLKDSQNLFAKASFKVERIPENWECIGANIGEFVDDAEFELYIEFPGISFFKIELSAEIEVGVGVHIGVGDAKLTIGIEFSIELDLAGLINDILSKAADYAKRLIEHMETISPEEIEQSLSDDPTNIQEIMSGIIDTFSDFVKSLDDATEVSITLKGSLAADVFPGLQVGGEVGAEIGVSFPPSIILSEKERNTIGGLIGNLFGLIDKPVEEIVRESPEAMGNVLEKIKIAAKLSFAADLSADVGIADLEVGLVVGVGFSVNLAALYYSIILLQGKSIATDPVYLAGVARELELCSSLSVGIKLKGGGGNPELVVVMGRIGILFRDSDRCTLKIKEKITLRDPST